MINFELRKAQRKAHCRVCDRVMTPKEDNVMYTYSMRNRGQNILICFDCIREIHSAVLQYEEDKK